MTFKSTIYQENGVLDASQLYRDIHETIGPDRKDRTHPLQHILNSTSGGYIAPTSMKSFESCPAGYLYNKLVPEKRGSAVSIGHSFHDMMEEWYGGEDRSDEKLLSIAESIIERDQHDEKTAETLKLYVNGYLSAPDYLDQRKFDHQKLECSSELFLKPAIKPLGVDIGVRAYCKIDRVDIRENGLYIVDYKTGLGDPTSDYLLGEHGYLPQFIFYKWVVEEEYGQEINKALMSLPGADTAKYKWIEMNVNSLVEQSKVVEKIFHHLEHIRKDRETKCFEEKIMRYCGGCNMKSFCQTYIEEKNLEELPLNEIPVEIPLDEWEKGE